MRPRPVSSTQRVGGLGRGGARCTCGGEGVPTTLGGTHGMKVRGFWSRLRDWRSLRGSSPCQGNPLILRMIWSCKSLGGRGCSDREKTELEQWARHLGVPGTVGTVSRPLEPKHATWGRSEGCCHSLLHGEVRVRPPQGGSALLWWWGRGWGRVGLNRICNMASRITGKGLLFKSLLGSIKSTQGPLKTGDPGGFCGKQQVGFS